MSNAPAIIALVVLLVAASCRAMPASPEPSAGAPALTMPAPDNAITRIERVASSPALGGQPGVEIAVTSAREFPVLSELATLRIGARSFTVSRYAGGDLHTLIFTLPPGEFDALDDGAAVSVQYGGDPPLPGRSWSFGPLPKKRLR